MNDNEKRIEEIKIETCYKGTEIRPDSLDDYDRMRFLLSEIDRLKERIMSLEIGIPLPDYSLMEENKQLKADFKVMREVAKSESLIYYHGDDPTEYIDKEFKERRNKTNP